jgi:hypothetical protein
LTKGSREGIIKVWQEGAQPEPEVIITEPVELHYLTDRRDFLEKV